MIKKVMLAVAATAAIGIFSLATPSNAKADVCIGPGYGYGGYGPSYRSSVRYRGGYPPYYGRSSLYRGGYSTYGYDYGRSFYGYRGRGISFSIGY